jgi:hypothetical protein
MKTVLQTLLLVVVIFALAVAVDQITPLKQFTLYLGEHPEPYKSLAIGMSIVGWALLIGAFLFGLWIKGRPMSEAEAQEYMQSGAGRPGVRRIFKGQAAGRQFRGTASFREIKEAVRRGAWVHDSSWWPILVGLLAAPLIAYGMFGYFFVIGAPLVKLFCGGALAYATVRTVWGFWKA